MYNVSTENEDVKVISDTRNWKTFIWLILFRTKAFTVYLVD